MHADSYPIYHARTMIHSGTDPKAIRKLLDSEAKTRGVAISKVLYKDELPFDERCVIEGAIFEVNKIDFFRRFELNNNLAESIPE